MLAPKRTPLLIALLMFLILVAVLFVGTCPRLASKELAAALRSGMTVRDVEDTIGVHRGWISERLQSVGGLRCATVQEPSLLSMFRWEERIIICFDKDGLITSLRTKHVRLTDERFNAPVYY